MSGTLVVGRLGKGPELAALIEGGRVTDWVFGPATGPAPETLYKARIGRPAPGAGAAFVDLGPHGQGFLREPGGLKAGAVVLVEAVSLPEPGKAVPVSLRVLYRQRYAIHTPGAPGINVARAIGDEAERARLVAAVADHIQAMEDWLARAGAGREDDARRVRQVLDCHRTGGTILRSAAAGQDARRLTRDLDLAVAARLDAEEALADAEVPPGAVAPVALPRDLALREWGARIGRVVAAGIDLKTFRALEEARASPFADRIEETKGVDPLDHFGVWDEIEHLKSPRVDLPSGGWMAVEATRAMVTVDVNTAAEFAAGAAISANVEAARELPRQLRLRGLGGQVVVDFAPMKKADRKRIEQTLASALARDPVATTVAGWTPLGHLELQRKRERRPLAELM